MVGAGEVLEPQMEASAVISEKSPTESWIPGGWWGGGTGES